jgi:hypothetical protein
LGTDAETFGNFIILAFAANCPSSSNESPVLLFCQNSGKLDKILPAKEMSLVSISMSEVPVNACTIGKMNRLLIKVLHQ